MSGTAASPSALSVGFTTLPLFIVTATVPDIHLTCARISHRPLPSTNLSHLARLASAASLSAATAALTLAASAASPAARSRSSAALSAARALPSSAVALASAALAASVRLWISPSTSTALIPAADSTDCGERDVKVWVVRDERW